MQSVEAFDAMPSTPSAASASSKSGTPTTAASSATSAASSSNASQSRRPPRKSTLTQQQKNQKRQRATQDQLALLELEFERNPTPAGPVRERIAQDINMTERSVQIWFQNRRAKIKLLTKKTIESGEDCDAIPESYRKYLAMQALESGKPLARNLLGGASGPFGNTLLLGGENQTPQKVIIQHFQCKSLSIGSWRRVGQNAMDLVTFYTLGEKPCITYYINNESAGYKIEYPFSYIKNITLENGNGDEPGQYPAGLLVELNRPPNFFMDSSGGGGFYQCGDFTENQQASQVLVHHLGGEPRVLSGQLAKLTLLESFQNRHFLDTSAVALSAPVSPLGPRPASQPNVMPQPSPNLYQDPTYGMSLQPPRGHKRTRSRSVPAITDFSFLHQPMPSFHVQHPSTTITDPSIFAPVPQHPVSNPSANLRIDTARTYGLDYGRAYPMSATTTNSPSEYASPGFPFAAPPCSGGGGPGSSIDSTGMPSAPFMPSYSLPFLSPMPEHAGSIAPSVSPLSALSPSAEPVIADHSPPLNTLHRSASADFLDMPPEHAGFGDEGLALGELYPKHHPPPPLPPPPPPSNLSLPIRSPVADGEPHGLDLMLPEGGGPAEELDVQHMLPFGTIDPAQLSPDPVGV